MMGVQRSDTVSYHELSRALRLANELRELPHGSEQQRVHALDGLCALVDAQVGLWIAGDGQDEKELVIQTALDRGWSTASERKVFLHYCRAEQRRLGDPAVPALVAKLPAGISTWTREQLLDDRDWYGSEHVQEIRRAAGVDSFIYAMARSPSIGTPCISLNRPWGARPFTERERRIVDVFHRECRWLHEPSRSVDAALLRGLGPRLCQTLRLLARGLGEKQVAAELGLSPHTVHEYVKTLYRHFGVSSRGELLALCLGGSPAATWGDAPGRSSVRA